MEVAIGGNGSTPFQREVREWQRVDPNTGALLTGRLEADRWINGPLNAYGKVVDSQNVSQPNGTQHSQRKQLEVLQARTSSGSLQVVRAHTVQTSSSRWSSGTKTTQSIHGQRFSNGMHLANGHGLTNGHDDHFSHQPSLKLSTLMKSTTAASNGGRSSPHSPPVSTMSLAQRHHQHLQKHDTETTTTTIPPTAAATNASTQSILAADGRYQPTVVIDGGNRVGGSSEPTKTQQMEIFRNERETTDAADILLHLHRGRSISTDDLATEWDQNDNDEESSEWRRVSKIRRSFQFPKSTSPKPSPPRPLDLPENSVSVSRIRQELENGRRLSTAMRNNHVDLAALDNILNGSPDTETKSTKKASFLTAESLKEIRGKLKKLSDESLYKEDFITQNDLDKTKNGESFTVQAPVILQDSQVIQQPSFQYRPKSETNHTNSLENRTRYRDTTSAEWHLRRKSYGFEKMAPPSTSMFRQETSTDSGIGRSGELSNWSPTDSTPRATIITFGEASTNPSPKTTVTVMNGHGHVNRRYHNVHDSNSPDSVEIKRHSIAVDESKYVRDNLRKVFDSKTSIHINGGNLYTKEVNSSQVSVFDDNGKRQKRVEFCKTEVHFAAESGRVNIVETDGKPPPTNNFRRRRRGSGPSNISSSYLEAINSGMPVIHFGDERKALFEQETAVEETQSTKNNVTVITNGGGPEVVVPTTLQEEDEEQQQQQLADEISLRGILKNKPIKPKPYHLGDNIESGDSLWGVRLRPVSGEFSAKKVEELQEVGVDQKELSSTNSKTTVAERVRIVEERKDGTGYSTKINLNLSSSPYSWETPDPIPQQELNKPIKLRLEDHKSTQLEILNDSLKSTSLIMRQMRSSTSSTSHYDEAIKQIKPKDITSHMNGNLASRLISNMNAITKSSSANSIFYDSSKSMRPKYASSLDGDIILNDEESSSHSNSSKIASSSSFSSTSSSSFQFERAAQESHVRHMEVLREESHPISMDPKRPVAAPRVRVIGSSNAVSHQLSQLRRMYDAAELDSDDSAKADEEVNLYLGGGGMQSIHEEKIGELSGSWSRIKAKRTSRKQTKDEIKELPKSNVMSIELHSPTVTLKKSSAATIVPSRVDGPTALPRNKTSVKTTQSIETETKGSTTYQTESLRKQQPQDGHKKTREPLKIENGGTRKLRDHELLYFGIKLAKNEENNNSSQQIAINSETNRKTLTNNEINANKWKLSSDKPDLLRHSPVVTKMQSSNETPRDEDKKQCENRGPIYENVKKPSANNRKRDVQRDKMILNEMNQAADQALKAINNEKSQKDQRRTPQRCSQPLDTIDEKRSTKPLQSTAKAIISQTDRSRNSIENFHRRCCSTRSSSVSSSESLSRLSGSSRSSRSRDTKDSNDYVNIRPTKKRTPIVKDCGKNHRSSSRDTQRTNASSSEDLHNGPKIEQVRRTRKTKPKEKEKIVIKVDEHQRITRSSVKSDDHHKAATRTSHDISKGSQRSSKGDKNEKISSSRSKVPSSSTRTSSEPHQKTKSKQSPGILATTSSSTKRSSRDHTRK